ncbi:MAG: phosphoribosyltransferase [Chitinophagales bacterium]|nr:phosphoribosyltransferase [Chitinophagales bacterium]
MIPDITKAHKILDAARADQKLDRIAYQILENHHLEAELFLIGIQPGGTQMAAMLATKIMSVSNKQVHLYDLFIDKPQPSTATTVLSGSDISLTGKPVIIVDDVGNTGRTLFYALYPLYEQMPKSIHIAVLVDRMHKAYPIKADFVGFPLATTINEHVIVQFEHGKVEGAYLF